MTHSDGDLSQSKPLSNPARSQPAAYHPQPTAPQSPPASLPSVDHDLQLEEFKALKAEVATLQREMRFLERGALAATGAFWAWLATNEHPHGAWWLGALFPALAAYRAYAYAKSIAFVGEYLRELEAGPLKGSLGWETFLKTKPGAGEWRSGATFWLVFLLTALLVAATLDPIKLS